MALQHLRSSTANKRPTPGAMSDGQLAMNTNLASPGLFLKDSNGDLVKVGPVHVGTTAPNATPAAGGQAGNSVGEQWLDTSSSRYVFKIWDGTAWRTEDGEFVNISGDTMTGALGIIAGTAGAPGVFFSGDTNTGIYSPGANQVAVATNGTGRLFIDASGNTSLVAPIPLQLGNITTDAANKSGRATALHYTNAEEPVGLIGALSTATEGSVYIGGGFSNVNAATDIRFLTAANNTTTVGTERLRITSAGLVGIGTSSPRSLVSLADSNDPTITIENTDTTMSVGQLYGAVDWYGNDASVGAAGVRARVSAIEETGQGATSLVFSNTAAASATLNERARIDSSGRVGIGTVSPARSLQVTGANSGEAALFRLENNQASGGLTTQAISIEGVLDYNNGGSTAAAGKLVFGKEGTYTTTTSTINSYLAFHTVAANTQSERARIDSSGRLGIGTTSPGALLDCKVTSSKFVRITEDQATSNTGVIRCTESDGSNRGMGVAGNFIAFLQGADNTGTITERARIDTSGRLLVGTSSAVAVSGVTAGFELHSLATTSGASASIARFNADAAGPQLNFGKSRSGTLSPGGIVQNNDALGEISFCGDDGTDIATRAASIGAEVDGTPGTNDMPGRLVFATTADGASSPTERMRLTKEGYLLFSTTTNFPGNGNTATGIMLESAANGSTLFVSRGANTPLYVNRNTNDGVLIGLNQDGTNEGSISISGTTVSYNGAHLSRWSQLPSGAERTEILRGSVLSNIDEMCEWGEEDNEQLNRMKVSDVEGDKNVSGVFQDWDDDDETYTDDFYCAMTGDFIIRIAEGVTVERGDLLMSAGDGTAKPQDDDIIRSKTIAKVTSTNVSCTYNDGSYCVPCVLMAC